MERVENIQPTSEIAELGPAERTEPETIHSVLAAQARSRSAIELWAGTVVGAANAALIWMRFPSAHWLAAGFAATAAYGLWGLADRKLDALLATPDSTRLSRALMKMLRVVAGTSGWAWALFAIAAFVTAGLRLFGTPGG
jgi:hypothetical protein